MGHRQVFDDHACTAFTWYDFHVVAVALHAGTTPFSGHYRIAVPQIRSEGEITDAVIIDDNRAPVRCVLADHVDLAKQMYVLFVRR